MRIGVHIRSFSARNEFIGVIAMLTSAGASSEVTVIDDEEPMCMHTTVLVSTQAAKKGSQWSPWRPGRPSFSGFSENVTAWQPFAAVRRISSAINCGSHNGMIVIGMIRSGYVPAHSSMCQSLYACTTTWAEVLVLCPQEQLAAEVGEGREVDRAEHAVGVHVPHPLVDVVAARAHLVVAQWG